jgi:hypothetical protein
MAHSLTLTSEGENDDAGKIHLLLLRESSEPSPTLTLLSHPDETSRTSFSAVSLDPAKEAILYSPEIHPSRPILNDHLHWRNFIVVNEHLQSFSEVFGLALPTA